MRAVGERIPAAASANQPTYQLVRSRNPAALGGAVHLDDAQRSVVEHTRGPLLLLAGPGTGKTTTLVAAAARRIHEGADPTGVLMLTFGRRAAVSLRERVVAQLGRAVSEPLARTFHSYAFGLLRLVASSQGQPPPRLLTGAEQDLLIRELLAGDAGGDGVVWPTPLRAALRTRGFATQLRDLLSRCYERGVDPVTLHRWGQRYGREDWCAAAAFMQQYADITELRDASAAMGTAYDPAELIRAAIVALRGDAELLALQRRQTPFVYVDEYSDCDPGQEELLGLLAGGGRFVVAAGDPDQSIYAFRGAEPDCIRRFPRRFPAPDGSPAPAVRLRTSYRASPELLDASRRFGTRIKGSAKHRALKPAPAANLNPPPSSSRTQAGANGGERPDVGLSVHVLGSVSQEAALIAEKFRAAHLLDDVPWRSMAVIVRSAARSAAVLRRAMARAGVPVAISSSEIPLADHGAVTPWLLLLRCAVDESALDALAVESLVTSPLGGGDALTLRRLHQRLRHLPVAEAGSTAELLVRAVLEPELLSELDERVVEPITRVSKLHRVMVAALAEPEATIETVLWAGWEASGLAEEWLRRSAGGGTRGAAADRDLDSVMGLFEAAARFTDRMPAAGPLLFIDYLTGQQIPVDPFTLTKPVGDGVRVVTAHSAKGLEWDVVAVAGVQEGLWPDVGLRGSLLGVTELVELASGRELPDAAARAAAFEQLLDEERRLFYTAITRARTRLIVTAVDDAETQPSRFIDELDPPPIVDGVAVRELGTAPRPLRLPALVTELRRVVTGLETSPASVSANSTADRNSGENPDPLSSSRAEEREGERRRVAAAVLAKLARAGVPGADPTQWWGVPEISDARPLVDPGDSVRVSPSALEKFTQCALRWLLETSGGGGPPGVSQKIGNAVHEVAALAPADAGVGELLSMLKTQLADIDLGTGWYADRQRERAETMVRKLAGWLERNPREFVAAEEPFSLHLGRAVLSGRVDRLERDEQGRLHVIDFKTGKSQPAKADLATHPQLGAYQLAAEQGGFTRADPDAAVQPDKSSEVAAVINLSGGAALVQLGGTQKAAAEQRQEALSDAPDPKWAERLVTAAADGMAGAVFTATDGTGCRTCPVRLSCPLHSDQTTS